MQTRILDYGETVSAIYVKKMLSTLVEPSVLTGGVISIVGSNTLSISPISLILPDGVLMIEDTSQSLTITLGTAAQSYTIYYTHDPSDITGGIPAVLKISAGLFNSTQLVGTVVGWLQYPGGQVPLDSTMVVQPPHTRVSIPSLVGMRDRVWANDLTKHAFKVDLLGTALTSIQELVGGVVTSKFTNNSAALSRETWTISTLVSTLPPGTLYVGFKGDTQTSLLIRLVDANNTQYSLVNSTVSGTTGMALTTYSFSVSNAFKAAVYAPGSRYRIELVITQNPATSVWISDVALSNNTSLA